MNKESIRMLISQLLHDIGETSDREGLIRTPSRVAQMYEELFRGYHEPPPDISRFKNGSDGITYDEMIIDEGEFHSMCEHHMMPFFGKYYFGYIPHPEGYVLGLSKISRVVDYFSARLQIQERLVKQIVDYLDEGLRLTPDDLPFPPDDFDNTPPLGMILVMKGEHLCKSMRGVKKKGTMTTSHISGVFKEDKVKQEFFQLIGL